MYSEIPHDVDVVLEDAEINPCRIVIPKSAKRGLLHKLAHLADGAGVDESVIDQQHALTPCSFVDEYSRMLGRCRNRLLDEHMLPAFNPRKRELEVRADRRGDRDGVDIGPCNQLGRALTTSMPG